MKKILHDMYLHRSAVDDLPEPHRWMVKLAMSLTGLGPDVICISSLSTRENGYSVRFAWVDDFDRNPEPAILRMQTYRIEGTNATLVKQHVSRNGNPQVYHAKELLVREDYPGFSVAKAKARRARYLKLNPDKKRMGYQKWWHQWLKENKISRR